MQPVQAGRPMGARQLMAGRFMRRQTLQIYSGNCRWQLVCCKVAGHQSARDRVELNELLLKPGTPLHSLVGPLEVEDIEGCGRGLVATRAAAAGDILLACVPLAVLEALPGRLPHPSSLAKQLVHAGTQGSSSAVAAYQGLVPHGVSASGRHTARGQDGAYAAEQVDLGLLASLPDWNASAGTHRGASSSVYTPAMKQGVAVAGTKALRNAWVEPTQDVAAATLRKEKLAGVSGVWPAMALINHACSPNASVILYSQRQLVIRAARDIEEGDEVTITYAGPAAAAPIQVRRDYLRKGFGFTCQCHCCLTEQDYEEELVGKAAQALYEELQTKLKPRLLTYLDLGEEARVKRIELQLAAGLQKVQEHLAQVEDVKDREVLESSYLPLGLELLGMCTMFAAPDEETLSTAKGRKNRQQQQLATAEKLVQSYRVRLPLLERVGPGSSALCQLAARFLNLAQHTRNHQDIVEAADTYARASKARYGVLTPDTFQRLRVAQEDNGLADALATAAAAGAEA